MTRIPIYPIIKVASSCNLNCKYCSAESYMERGRKSIMSHEVLEATISELGNTQASSKYLWHGGEALLAGLEFYDKVLELQRLHDAEGQNTIQTNGVLLTNQWIDFFKANEFNIGLSIDGTPELHDENRVFSNGAGSHRTVMSSASKLQNSNQRFGILVVVTNKSVQFAKEIFTFLLENDIKSIDFKPCYGDPANDVSLTDFADFMKQIFDDWVALDDPTIRIRTLEGYVYNLLGATSKLCSQSGNCVSFITINTNGDIYPCDRFIDSSYRYGNILNRQLANDMKESIGAKEFTELINGQRVKCQTCPIATACKGGCTQERQYWPDEYCAHRFSIISHIYDWLIAEGHEPILTLERR